MKYRALRLFLWRWHRRLGLTAAIFLIWLAVSGILLNHTVMFDLASKSLPLNLAGAVSPLRQVEMYQSVTPLGQVTQVNQRLLLDDEVLEQCQGAFRGWLELRNEFWFACDEQLLLLNSNGAFIEAMDRFSGLPTPIQRLGVCDNSVCVESSRRNFQFDELSGSWQAYTEQIIWQGQPTPTHAQAAVIPEIHNWERLILEAHSGRLFGRFGVLIVDLVALASILLALSGCYVWWSHNRRRKLASRKAKK